MPRLIGQVGFSAWPCGWQRRGETKHGPGLGVTGHAEEKERWARGIDGDRGAQGELVFQEALVEWLGAQIRYRSGLGLKKLTAELGELECGASLLLLK